MRGVFLTIHGLWFLWMIGGAVIALMGFRYPRLWRMSVFRTTHLVALLATATVPIWNRGICPFTDWEAKATGQPTPSFLSRVCEWILYWDAPVALLSALSAAVAIVTLMIYIWHPPWRARQLQPDRPKVGQRA